MFVYITFGNEETLRSRSKNCENVCGNGTRQSGFGGNMCLISSICRISAANINNNSNNKRTICMRSNRSELVRITCNAPSPTRFSHTRTTFRKTHYTNTKERRPFTPKKKERTSSISASFAFEPHFHDFIANFLFRPFPRFKLFWFCCTNCREQITDNHHKRLLLLWKKKQKIACTVCTILDGSFK